MRQNAPLASVAVAAVFVTSRNRIMSTLLIVILVLILIGALPTWPHSRKWGYGPSGLTGLAVVVLIVLLLSGRL
jgi:hypothetical protein